MAGHPLLIGAAAASLFLMLPAGPTSGSAVHFGPATATAQVVLNPQCVDPTFATANPRLCGLTRRDDTVHNPSSEDANKPPEVNPAPSPTQNGNAGNGGNGGQNNGNGNPPGHG